MKIKGDFVTNSSSANFILFIKSTADNLDDFQKSWNQYIEDISKINMWVYEKMNISKVNKHIYQIENSTSMLNCLFTDLPKWMTYLIILHNIKSRKLLEYGFKDVRLYVETDNEGQKKIL